MYIGKQVTGETTTSIPEFSNLVNKWTVLLRSPDHLITCSNRKAIHARENKRVRKTKGSELFYIVMQQGLTGFLLASITP
jgi:hypothetical protein